MNQNRRQTPHRRRDGRHGPRFLNQVQRTLGAVPISVMSAINVPHSILNCAWLAQIRCATKEFADAMLEPTIEQTILDGANIIKGAHCCPISRKSTVLEEIVVEFSATK